MNEKDFIINTYSAECFEGETQWTAPSNIALIKYWGKEKHQIPANPSISFTLSESKTITTLGFKRKEKISDDFSFDFFFEGQPQPSFRPKIQTFFERIEIFLPFLKAYHWNIASCNTFPHSSGIASSASAMAALSVALLQVEQLLFPQMDKDFFWRKASFLARLGSGSACRSIYPGLVLWGKHKDFDNSSNLYGIPYPKHVHPVFHQYQDTILLIDKGAKKVSSSLGHQLMHKHPFAKERFNQAHRHISELSQILAQGDLEAFSSIVESEALTLHAMMMTSQPCFILMKPNTLHCIERIQSFRERLKIPVSFTLDAGANLHLLYPKSYKDQCLDFISNELIDFCENKSYICDHSS